jgi:hypothetical protein
MNGAPQQMVTDFMRKPIQGSHFRHLRDYFMGRVCSSNPKMEAVRVDKKINNKKKKVNGKGRVKVVAQLMILLRHRSVLGFIAK